MKMKNAIHFVLVFCAFITMKAQTFSINYADKKFDKYAYADAVKGYEDAAEKGSKDEKILQRLGDYYYFTAELNKALKWYDELFLVNQEQEAEYLYRYAQCLKSAGNYKKADEILMQFNQKAFTDKRGVLFENNKNYLESIKYNSGRFQIADAGINSPYSDYGSAVFDNKLIFASTRDTAGVYKKSSKWQNKAFSNLYTVDLMPDGSIGIPKRFHKKINTKFNESTPIFTKDGRTMYFTRNNFINGKRGENDKKVTLLKLYKSDFVDSVWTEAQELPFNSDQYSVAHPALSIDEKTLYFASDMPGTLGQSDLFKAAINTDGTFGKPENLGPDINTEGRETFPFISGDNEIYFSSDGRPGLGGLDIFVSKINEDGSYDEIQNIGEPINSKQDDFAFIINSKNRNGFFSSNRENGNGFDDVYRFTETRRLVCEQQLTGTITDQETNEVLSNVSLVLFDEARKTAVEAFSDANGNYIFSNLKCGKKYFIKTSKTDYEIKDASIAVKKSSVSMSFALEKKAKPITAMPIVIKTTAIKPVKFTITVGTDLGKLLHIPMNFFDLGKATIKKTSEPQLQKIIDLLNQYPNIKIDIRSHTDSRSSAESNQILSEKRAQSTKSWFEQKGIDAARLTAKGFGETQLVNKCADGVKCTEKEHQQNRRSEFIIISL